MVIDPKLANIWPNETVFGTKHSYKREMNDEGLYRIQRWELFVPHKYVDVIDKDGKTWYAIGFGHGGASGIWPSQEEIANGNIELTLDQAHEIFHKDLDAEYVPGVDKSIYANITTYMFNALVMTAFNMGMTRFRKTDMVWNLNQGKYIAACASFISYNKAINQETRVLEVRNGLTCRRMDEGSLFLTKKE